VTLLNLEELAAAIAERINVQPRGLLTIDKAAEYLACSKQQVRNLIAAGRLRPVLYDSHPRLKVADLEKFIDAAKR
jgi:excisionase family DNA binding protein